MNNEERMREFAFFTCFKTTQSVFKNQSIEKQIGICARQAYLDFCRTIDYDHYKIESEKYKDNEWKEKVNGLIKLFYDGDINISEYSGLIEGIKGLIKCETNFDETHEKLCEDISKVNAQILKNNLTIGQAQKWVNMTIKYMWMNGLVQCQQSVLHVPIDNYILKAIYENKQNRDNGELVDIKKDNDQYRVKENGNYITWSQITDYNGCYMQIQETIKAIAGSVSPIEWEYTTWLNAAQNGI